MARNPLAYTNLVANSGLAEPAGTAVNAGPGNGHSIAAAHPERTILRVTNTAGTPKNVTIKAGAYPPAMAAGQGDIVVAVAATTGVSYLGPFESGRIMQKDGSISIDIEAGHTGNITAFLEPKAK